ncbi:hypothetical protein K437DRAFT_232599 [Tilletiaria anomala UBC 951]|uniref:Methyltransferase domain-containing protein n=1 Tax=Tilletiaria anomala (strain ATCC 24038 / CBS 436.72 / UBC 951) TaxID=1037660 RepID=A0A066WEN2_TILAU|nr:uncharacterized protein K437DRAFT_232599 [Tilletiaria anomala UBC 951]KDN52226.1 hypothetical protein K437DRAFT_232599 [Tilletiaria anomala UBC 951]
MVVSTSASTLYERASAAASAALSSHSHILWLGFAGILVLVLTGLLIARLAGTSLKAVLVFAYNCFLQPLGETKNQVERLDRFYQGQANVYDATRSGLLRGRKTMLKLCAAQLREMQEERPGKPLVWVDIGGGTGWNIEQMDQYFDVTQLSAIYLIDLCEPLLEVARRRFTEKGWKNVHVYCQDAKEFVLPGLKDGQKVDLFTCSYSLSMIPPFYTTLDRINQFLDPETGVFGVADFYVSDQNGSSKERSLFAGGDASRHCGWLSRCFWRQWFSLDHVELHPARRDYLEHRFGTIKCFNGRNNFILPFIVRIPYYIWIGCSRQRDTTAAVQAFEIEAGNRTVVPPSFPEISFQRLSNKSSSDLSADTSSVTLRSDQQNATLTQRRRNSSLNDERWSDTGSLRALKLDLGPQFPLSSFHYQKKQWRLPFVDDKFADMFRTWIYGFTWEDPYVDMQHLNLTTDDSVLCITSAGDNALHYAIAAQPKRIHAVDMNPCQGHLLELKLACIATLEYDEFWQLFGEGKHPNFRELLDSKLAPYLSSHAYQFWRLNTKTFDRAFYFRGYSGHALRIAKWAFQLMGVTKDVKRMCDADSVAEQQKIWDTRLRRALINRTFIRIFLSNPAFLWNALGVPMNQYNVFRKDVSVEQFAIDTLDAIPSYSLIKNSNYHYRLCLMGNYTKDSCPLYLKLEAFKRLKADSAKLLDTFRLHTNSIVNVLRGLEDESLTRAITMDHMDWFDPVPESTPVPTVEQARNDEDKSISDLDREVVELYRCMRNGGFVLFRTAGRKPWYVQRFEACGFKAEPVHFRETGKPIDAVNMYASTWICRKEQ